MTGKEPTWTDGDLVAIAAGLEWTLGPCWSRLVARDPGLKSFPLRVALSKLRALGLRSDFEHPAGPLGRSGPEVESALSELWTAVERVRAIGAEALTDPIFHAARLGCIAPFPRWWYRLPASDPDGRVQLVHHGDLPAGHPALSDLGRMGAAPGLRALVLAGSPLLQWQAPASLVDSSRLVHLDLAGCGLDHLPAFVLRTAALEVLRVDNNPLFDLAVLLHPDELPRLRGLGIGGTLLGPAFRERLRVARPGLRLLDEPAA